MFCEKNYNAFLIWFSFIVIIILNQLKLKKIDKYNFGKNYKKITWENIATIYGVLKKNNKAKFLIDSILKKNQQR